MQTFQIALCLGEYNLEPNINKFSKSTHFSEQYNETEIEIVVMFYIIMELWIKQLVYDNRLLYDTWK